MDLDVAKAAVDGGAAALFVHGRTRDARYRTAADWDAVMAVNARGTFLASREALRHFRDDHAQRALYRTA